MTPVDNALQHVVLSSFVASYIPQGRETVRETTRVFPDHVAIVPEPRTSQSLLLYNITRDGTPNPCATGTDKPMVLQRSTNNLDGSWENAYTNSITADNPHGSIDFVDTAAKGMPSVFYRVVSPETAKQTSVTGR